MNVLRQLLSLVVICCSIPLMQAQIISISENDRGDLRTILTTDKQIVDINATIEVSVSKAELLKAIKSQFPKYAEQIELEEKINALQEILVNQKSILTILEQEVASISSQQEFFSLMITFLDAVMANDYLGERYEALSIEFYNRQTHAEENEYAYIFSKLNDDIVELKNSIQQIDGDHYTISLVAFKKDKFGGDRVHVENFDNYSERDYVTIERWITNLSEDQKEELERLAAQAQENNEKALSIFEMLKSKLKTYLPKTDCIQTQVDLLNAFLNDPINAQQLSVDTQAKGSKIITDLTALINFMKSIDRDIASWKITTPFEVGNQFKDIITKQELLKAEFDGFKSIIETINALIPKIKTLATGFEACYKELKNYADQMQNAIILLKLQQSNYILNKEIGDEVHKFSIDNLPEKGFINLKGTGKRANGDELLVEVLLRIPSSQEGIPAQSFVLEQRTMVMQLIGARSEVVVGMILANPINDHNLDFESERKFYFSPAASLVLKFGSKNSYFYNEFVDLGIGINFAAPDFDTDGVPEFGTGLIVTGFKDILSIGFNYNVTLDAPYWFFGVNLPFNIPGIPVNTVKTN